MKARVRRRLINGGLALAGVLAAGGLYAAWTLSLHDASFVTGWLLLALLVALTLFNARKKLPFLPLLSARAWLQAHVYVGLVTVAVFLFHVDFRVPDGILEVTLAALFLGVVVSGIVGLLLSRAIPGRLRSRGELVLRQRQPRLLQRLRERLEELVDEVEATAVSDLYVRYLLPFFEEHRNFWWHLAQSHRPRRRLLEELEGLERYLDEEERAVVEEIEELIEKKDDLDYHRAHQAVLKRWLFVHVPLTYSLLVVAVVHAAVAHAWS